MNRKEEYTELLKELDESVPELQGALQRGRRRKARKQFLYQPLMGLAAVFMLFVLSVNLCAPVAKAFSNIPFLKEMTKAVTFSKSLRDAIENGYVQEMELKQTKDGVTVEITSVVVDEERVAVFYRFESEEYEKLATNCFVLDENDEDTYGCTVTTNYMNTSNSLDIANEDIRCALMEFWGMDMPKKMKFHMVVWDGGAYLENMHAGGTDEGNEEDRLENAAEDYYITSFDFELELNLASIPEALKFEVNQTLELDGQKITVTDVEVYPTSMHINVIHAPENTALLKSMHFYVENEDGERFRSTTGGLTGVYDPALRTMTSFYAESPYFHGMESLKLVVTGAEWLDKENDRTHVNLKTGEVSNLPDNVTLKGIRKENEMFYLDFEQQFILEIEDHLLKNMFSIDPFARWCYDSEGKLYDVETLQKVEHDDYGMLLGTSSIYEFCLKNYPYEEVWFEHLYSSIWTAEEEIVIKIK